MIKGDRDVDDGPVIPAADVVPFSVHTGDKKNRGPLNKFLPADSVYHSAYDGPVPDDDEFPWLQVTARRSKTRGLQNFL